MFRKVIIVGCIASLFAATAASASRPALIKMNPIREYKAPSGSYLNLHK